MGDVIFIMLDGVIEIRIVNGFFECEELIEIIVVYILLFVEKMVYVIYD